MMDYMVFSTALQNASVSVDKEPKNRLVRASIKGFWSMTSFAFWCVFAMACGLLIQPASAAGENNQPAVVSLEQCRNLAEDGNAEAQYKMGKMYEEGLGLPQDSKEAVKWYLKSAEKGCAKAQYKLGTMYTLGKGVPRDIMEAAKCFGKAAQQCYEPVKQQIQETAGKVNGDLFTNASKILQRLF